MRGDVERQWARRLATERKAAGTRVGSVARLWERHHCHRCQAPVEVIIASVSVRLEGRHGRIESQLTCSYRCWELMMCVFVRVCERERERKRVRAEDAARRWFNRLGGTGDRRLMTTEQKVADVGQRRAKVRVR